MMIKKAKWLFVALAIVMLVSLFSGLTGADEVPNYGFIPNSGEASVSKVDLVSMTEVARYYTAPRVGDMVDLLGDASLTANTITPYSWRTSRIAQDADGNAWVLNVGSDGPSSGITLQGSVVRIQADIEGLDTHMYPDPVKAFGSDEAVQVFSVGNVGNLPRAIAIDADGYIWIGFYRGTQLMKYEYDEDAKTLTPVGGPYYPASGTIRYYEMKFAPDGTLFISSRNAQPNLTPRTLGIWSFNGTTFVRETNFDPYSILISGTAENYSVYASAYSRVIHYRTSSAQWFNSGIITPTGNNNRGMAFDEDGVIWVASTTGSSGGTVVGWWNPMGEAGSDRGHITLDAAVGTTPVGVGRDASGLMWAICRTDGVAQGFIQAFDPDVKSGLNSAGSIQVGFRPYAYGDFTVDPPDEPCYYFDTVWAYGGETDPATHFGDENSVAFHNNKVEGNRSNAWGWTNFINAEGTYTWDVWAGAGQNDTTKGLLVGTVTVEVTWDDSEEWFCATVTGFDLGNNVLKEDHIWIGNTELPIRRGRVTAAPGQLGFNVGYEVCGLSADGFYVAIHGVVGIPVICE